MDKKYKTFKPTDLEFEHGEVFTQTDGELLDIFKDIILDDLAYMRENLGLNLSYGNFYLNPEKTVFTVEFS